MERKSAGAGTSEAGPRADAAEPAWVGEVLRFWFEQLSESQWWVKEKALDAKIRERFLDLHERLAGQERLGMETPRSALATVVVLDQFSRNLFRGSPRAYAADETARSLSRAAIEHGYDRELSVPERLFLYLPFEHSEDAADQHRSVELLTSLGNESWTRFALAHKLVIDRFGRFPHRNAALGRPSTPEEIEYLKDPNAGF